MRVNKIPGYYKYKELLFRLIKLIPEDNILIFADPRGGSTWLTEVIKEIVRLPVVWEPLHVRKIKRLESLNFSYRQNIPEDAKWPEAYFFFKDLFLGKIKSNWIYHREPLVSFVKNKAAIIKFCRANLLIPYLTNNFDFKKKPIYLIRHPFAVAASQINQGGWKNTDNTFNFTEHRFNDYILEHKEFLSSLKTKEEVLVANWCLTNKPTLDHPDNNKRWITITYEELLLNPELTINRVLDWWKIDYDLSNISFNKKSDTSIQNKELNKKDRLKQWQSFFSDGQITNMCRVLDYFKIQQYSKDVLPLIKYNSNG